MQRGIEGKEAGGTAHIPVAAKNFRAVLGLLFLQREFLAEGGQHIPSACMPDPAGDIFFPHPGPFEDRPGVAGGEDGDFGGEQISQEAVAVVKAKIVPVIRLEMRGGFHPTDLSFCLRRLSGDDCGRGAIPEEAGADQNAGVVVEV